MKIILMIVLALVLIGSAVVAWLGIRVVGDIVLGNGRILHQVIPARVEWNGVEQPEAMVFAVPIRGQQRGQVVVYIPSRPLPHVWTIERDGKDFGWCSGSNDHHYLLAGRYLLQSGMGRQWKPLSFFGPVTVLEDERGITAETKAERGTLLKISF